LLDRIEEGRTLGLHARRIIGAADLSARIAGCGMKRNGEQGSPRKQGNPHH